MILEPSKPGGGQVSAQTLSFPSRRRGDSIRRTRRTTRFALNCEPLESRQLLSVGQSGFGTGAAMAAAAPAAQLAVPAQVFNPAPSSISAAGIEFGTLAGVSQLQIIVFGAGGIFSQSFSGSPVFSPTPTAPFGGSGLELGSLSGIAGTNNNGIGNSETAVIFPTTELLITPLNPNVTSSVNTPGGPPVILVIVPLAPLVIHLSPSTAPATNQSNSTLISNLDELPPSTTHVGQGDGLDDRELFVEKLDIKPRSSSLIDFVEPFRPIAPVDVPLGQPAPQGEQAPAPDDAKVRTLPPLSDPNVDAALDLTDARVLTRSRDADSAEPDDQLSSTNTSWSFSAIFGAAAVASAGYHLAIREADRFRGRWIPRWVGAERPTKRKTGSPTR
jgi:hypothetical protein